MAMRMFGLALLGIVALFAFAAFWPSIFNEPEQVAIKPTQERIVTSAETDEPTLFMEEARQARRAGRMGVDSRADTESADLRARLAPRQQNASSSLLQSMPDRLADNKPIRVKRPLITSANVVKSGNVTITLAGIGAPAPGTKCKTDDTAWPCGTMARAALRRFVRGRTLDCIPSHRFDDQTLFGQCTVRGKDLGNFLVRRGWGVSSDSAHSAAQSEARLKGLGLWRAGQDAMQFLPQNITQVVLAP